MVTFESSGQQVGNGSVDVLPNQVRDCWHIGDVRVVEKLGTVSSLRSKNSELVWISPDRFLAEGDPVPWKVRTSVRRVHAYYSTLKL